jgi:hypothetical protein
MPSTWPAMIWLITPGSTNEVIAPAMEAITLIIQSAEIFILTSIFSVFDHPLLQLDGSRMLITQDCIEAILRLAIDVSKG